MHPEVWSVAWPATMGVPVGQSQSRPAGRMLLAQILRPMAALSIANATC